MSKRAGKKQLTLELAPELVERMDQIASAQLLTRSTWMRMALHAALRSAEQQESA
jgi:predicted transcriptional regulator